MYQRFLSRKQKPIPVITFVLYFGIEKAWDRARSIHEILNIPKELKRFIPDFRAEVIDLGALSNEMIDSLKSDLKEIARFIKTVRNGENQFNTSKKLDHFALVGHLLSILTSKKITMKTWETLQERGKEKMEHVINLLTKEDSERYLQQGIELGRVEGIELGSEQERYTIQNMMTWLKDHHREDLLFKIFDYKDFEQLKTLVLEKKIEYKKRQELITLISSPNSRHAKQLNLEVLLGGFLYGKKIKIHYRF